MRKGGLFNHVSNHTLISSINMPNVKESSKTKMIYVMQKQGVLNFDHKKAHYYKQSKNNICTLTKKNW